MMNQRPKSKFFKSASIFALIVSAGAAAIYCFQQNETPFDTFAISNPYTSFADFASQAPEPSGDFEPVSTERLQLLQPWYESDLNRSYEYVFLQEIETKSALPDSEFTRVNVAIGVNQRGFREILAVDWSNDTLGWQPTFETMSQRGVTGVKLFTIGSQRDIDRLIANHYPNAKWQRCYVHWKTDVQQTAPSQERHRVDFHIETIESSLNRSEAEMSLTVFINQLNKRGLMETQRAASTEISHLLTYFEFPVEHQRKIRTNHSMAYTLSRIDQAIVDRRIRRSASAYMAELLVALKEAENTRWADKPYIVSDRLATNF